MSLSGPQWTPSHVWWLLLAAVWSELVLLYRLLLFRRLEFFTAWQSRSSRATSQLVSAVSDFPLARASLGPHPRVTGEDETPSRWRRGSKASAAVFNLRHTGPLLAAWRIVCPEPKGSVGFSSFHVSLIPLLGELTKEVEVFCLD